MSQDQEKNFLQTIAENQQSIQKLCAMYAKNSEDHKDLVQEVMMNIWKSYGSFKGQSNINTWIYRIILNVCMKKTYSTDRKRTISMESDQLELIPSSENAIQDFTDLRSCIQSLNFADRSIILLFMEDVAYQDISELIGISENYVAVKIKRIKEKLANCLKVKSS